MQFLRYRLQACVRVVVVAALWAGTPLRADTWQASGLAEQSVFALARDAAGVLYAGTRFRLYASHDSGQTWTALPDLPSGTADVFGLAVNPATDHLFLVAEPGLYRSENGGISWQALDQQLVGAYHVAARPDGLLLAAGSTGTFKSTDDGGTWDLIHLVGSGTLVGDGLGFLPTGEFVELNHSSLNRSSNQGETWTDIASARDSGAFVSSFNVDRTHDLIYRADERVIDSLFRIGYVLYRSFDEGDSWERVDSGKYTVPDPLFCDSRGVVWTSRLNDVAAADLFRSKDSGTTWLSASEGLPPGTPVQCFLEYAPGLLFAGSVDSGLFRLSFSVTSCCILAGDANRDSAINAADAISLVNYVFKGGSRPACPAQGDVNNDAIITAGDVISIIHFIFRSGPALQCGRAT